MTASDCLDDAVAVMIDFVNPAWAGRGLLHQNRLARFDPAIGG
jgi:hypothetical protein